MRYKLLGNSGLRVSELCLGAMTFGEAWGWGASPAVSHAMIDRFFEAGGNFVDTANGYTGGDSETIIGDWLAAKGGRERMVLGTKFTQWLPGSDNPNIVGNSRKAMTDSVEASLRRLRCDYIDVYWVHAWDYTTRPEELMRGLDDLVRAGKILYPAISDAPAWVIAQCNTIADLRGWSPFVANQVEYSLLERAAERDLIPMSRTLDIAVVAWSPLGRGLLTGKYLDAGQGKRGRIDTTKTPVPEGQRREIVEAVVALARDLGRSPAEVALAWVRQQGTIPIVGATSVAQLDANIACLDLVLDADQLAGLDALSAIEKGFPHEFHVKNRGTVFGGFFDRLDRHREHGIGTNA